MSAGDLNFGAAPKKQISDSLCGSCNSSFASLWLWRDGGNSATTMYKDHYLLKQQQTPTPLVASPALHGNTSEPKIIDVMLMSILARMF